MCVKYYCSFSLIEVREVGREPGRTETVAAGITEGGEDAVDAEQETDDMEVT